MCWKSFDRFIFVLVYCPLKNQSEVSYNLQYICVLPRYLPYSFPSHFYFIIHLVYMRICRDGENISLQMLTDFHVLSPREYEESGFWDTAWLRVCLYICMNRLCFARAWKVGRILFIHGTQEVILPRSANQNIPVPKIGVLETDPKTQNNDFLKKRH
jgi:hypothetical protein